jgi:hypothetical protein
LDISLLLSNYAPWAKNPGEEVLHLDLDEYAAWFVSEIYRSDGSKTDVVWKTHLLERYGLGMTARTLNDIGIERGVSRERVRQVTERFFSERPQRKFPLPLEISNFIALSIQAKRDPSVDFATVSSEFLGNNWNLDSVASLLALTGWLEEAQKIKSTKSILNRKGKDGTHLRSQRNPLGFLDLENYIDEKGNQWSAENTWAAIQNAYSTTFRFENWAFARDAKPSQAETAVTKQFAVAQKIHVDELYEGIDRLRRWRQYPLLPPKRVVMELFRMAGVLELQENYASGEGSEIQGEFKNWLIQVIRSSPGQVIHTSDLMRQCIEDGYNTASLTSYLSFEPMVRRHENGLARLVGHLPSQEDCENAFRVAEIQRVREQLEWQIIENGAILIDLRIGTRFCTSGVISAPAQLRHYIANSKYLISCCDLQSFNAYLSFSNTFWYGFAPVAMHLMRDHGLREGDSIKVLLNSNHAEFRL